MPVGLGKGTRTILQKFFYYEIIHLVFSQIFPKSYYFLPPDTHTYVSGRLSVYVCVSRGKKW